MNIIETLSIAKREGIETVRARKLYEYLELDPSHYARWCKQIYNRGKTGDYQEGVDFIKLIVDGELRKEILCGPNVKVDLVLSINCAQHECLISNTPKGKEARQFLLDYQHQHSLSINVQVNEALLRSNNHLNNHIDMLEEELRFHKKLSSLILNPYERSIQVNLFGLMSMIGERPYELECTIGDRRYDILSRDSSTITIWELKRPNIEVNGWMIEKELFRTSPVFNKQCNSNGKGSLNNLRKNGYTKIKYIFVVGEDIHGCTENNLKEIREYLTIVKDKYNLDVGIKLICWKDMVDQCYTKLMQKYYRFSDTIRMFRESFIILYNNYIQGNNRYLPSNK